jgi:hypothetical protein
MVIHDSFEAWVEKEVRPLREKNPSWHRLDGEPSGGNRKVIGKFRHVGRVWEVHADTKFEPILRAYGAITTGGVQDPFTVQRAKVRDCLDLLPRLKTPKQHKYFYVYGRAAPTAARSA